MTHRDRLELVLLAAVWGASFLFMRIAAPEFGAIALAEMRIAIGALFLLLVLLWRGGVRELAQAPLQLTTVGLFNSAMPFALFAYGTLYVSAGTGAVVNATAPLFAAVVGYVWLRVRLDFLQSLGLAIGFAGVLLLVWDRFALNVDGAGLATGACLLATFSYGVAANYTKKALSGVRPLVNAAGSQLAASVLLMPLAIAYWPDEAVSTKSWLSAIALGVVCTGVAYILYFRLIARLGPTRAISVTYLIPVFGIFWGVIFLGETVSMGMLVAGAIILVGIALTSGGLRPGGRQDA
ncbi:MAG: DMT family transporter [Woeseiaceae bacterium]